MIPVSVPTFSNNKGGPAVTSGHRRSTFAQVSGRKRPQRISVDKSRSDPRIRRLIVQPLLADEFDQLAGVAGHHSRDRGLVDDAGEGSDGELDSWASRCDRPSVATTRSTF